MGKKLKGCRGFWLSKRIEYTIYILLGFAIATLFWLIFSAILILQNSPTILKDTLGSMVTVLTATVSVYFIIQQMKQSEKFQKETNTLQLIDNTLYNHFEKINTQIKSIDNKALLNYAKVKKKIPFDTQYDNIGTVDVEPNDNYTEAESQKHEISEHRSKEIDKTLDDFFKFIYDIEVKIEHNIIDEFLIKIYFKDKIEEIFTQKIMTKFSLEKDIGNIVLVNDFKKEKVVNLSKRWYEKNYIELTELYED